jgi:hypothetical protein
MRPASIIQYKILVAHVENDLLYAHCRQGSLETSSIMTLAAKIY